MNPMDFFNQMKALQSNAMYQPDFTPEKMLELKGMVKQYKEILNEDFWGDIQGATKPKQKKIEMIPIEIWEDAQNIYLFIVCPGIPDINHVRIYFHTDQLLTFKIKKPLRPEGDVFLLTSELPQYSYERKISLKKSVITSDFSSSFENGVLTYTFKKMTDEANQEIEIPFDF